MPDMNECEAIFILFEKAPEVLAQTELVATAASISAGGVRADSDGHALSRANLD